MRKTLAFLLFLVWAAQLAPGDDLSPPTLRILPEDVVQNTIVQSRISTNQYSVRWTYTEAGAKKMLAFQEAHQDQKVCTAIGSFVTPPSTHTFRPMPPTFTTYAQWKAGWLKHRTDNCFGVSEDDAKKVVAGLKGK